MMVRIAVNAGQRLELSKLNGTVHFKATDDREERPSFVGMQYVGMDLNREQIQLLIRQLRTIRDETYGADE